MGLSYITILRVESVDGSSRLSRSHHGGRKLEHSTGKTISAWQFVQPFFLGKIIVPPHSTWTYMYHISFMLIPTHEPCQLPVCDYVSCHHHQLLRACNMKAKAWRGEGFFLLEIVHGPWTALGQLQSSWTETLIMLSYNNLRFFGFFSIFSDFWKETHLSKLCFRCCVYIYMF